MPAEGRAHERREHAVGGDHAHTGPWPVVTCPSCGSDVPERAHCVVCGDRLAAPGTGRLRRAFAATPEEPALTVSAISTLLPRLPHADLQVFRALLVIGLLIVVTFAAAGYFPVGLAVAVVVVPWLVLVYLRSVDVWESEPWRVLLFTLVWGAVVGVLTGVVIRSAFTDPVSLSDALTADAFLRIVIVPIVAGALMVAGPLVLARQKRFNDVLDGATFGAITGSAFVGAQFLTQSSDLFTNGLQPGGDLFGWVLRLLLHAVVLPLLAAGAASGLCAAFWLNYRAPVTDRARLGALGRPLVAALAFAALMVTMTAALLLLRDWLRFVVELALAGLALVWLRLAVHVGLLEEAAELLASETVRCPNCHRETPPTRFCAECGMSLRAVPKQRASAPAQPTETQP